MNNGWSKLTIQEKSRIKKKKFIPFGANKKIWIVWDCD
jgi:hypothetical protein